MGYRVNNRCDTDGFPFYLIEELIKEYTVKHFIETGTAGGETIRQAAQRFDNCVTIELFPNFDTIDTKMPIRWEIGNSIDILPKIVHELISEKAGMQSHKQDAPPVYNYAIFFLDAHYSGSEPNKTGYHECPLLQELDIISVYQADAIIIIDDARLFFGQPPAPLEPREWASISQIFALLHKKYPYNTSTIRDDYIISYPSRLDEPFDREWRGNYTIRYPNADDKLLQQAKDVYAHLIKYLEI